MLQSPLPTHTELKTMKSVCILHNKHHQKESNRGKGYVF